MKIARRLFVVVLGNDQHGKSTIVNALLSQGLGKTSPKQKGRRTLVSPFGRQIDSYVFVRAYQEYEKKTHKKVDRTLDANDAGWKTRELIIFPSHVRSADIAAFIDAAHGAGFDAICAAVILNDSDRRKYAGIWCMDWDERWTVPNPTSRDDCWQPRTEALGRDLWVWICQSIGC